MDKNVQGRLQQAVDTLCGGNKSEFCRRIGRPAQAIKDIIGGKMSAPGFDLIFDILSSDLGISPNWLILGEGPMMVQQPAPSGPDNGNMVFIGNLGELKAIIADAIRENK